VTGGSEPDLTARDKLAIAEVAARVAVTMLLAILAFCELLMAATG
jgi:hypothetical protein